jgi:hypothetical protein
MDTHHEAHDGDGARRETVAEHEEERILESLCSLALAVRLHHDALLIVIAVAAVPACAQQAANAMRGGR